MRSLKNGQRLLACDSTTTRVFIQNHNTKTSLAKPWPDGEILAEPAANRLTVLMIRLGHLREEWLSLLEKPQSFTTRENLKTFPCHDIGWPVVGRIDIHGFFQIKGLGEYCAANDGIKLLIAAQVAYLLAEQRKAWHSVCFSKCLPGKIKRQCRVSDKECTSHDLVFWVFGFEQKELACFKNFELGCCPRSPKIHFFSISLSQIAKPIGIRNANIQFHDINLLRRSLDSFISLPPA